MIQQLLLAQLDRVAVRHRWLRVFRLLALIWLLAAINGAVLWTALVGRDAPSGSQAGIAWFALVIVLSSSAFTAFGIWRILSSPRNYAWLASRVEEAFPELHSSLLASIEQRPDRESGEFGYLQSSVMRDALMHSYRHRWADVISTKQLLLGALANFILIIVCAVVLTGAIFTAAKNLPALANLAPVALPAGRSFAMTIEPGNTEIERGTSLLVIAKIQGQLPAEATLHYTIADGEEQIIAMNPSLADPIFGGRIPVVEEELEYYVTAESQSSPKYRVTVFEYPKLDRADAKLVYPQYTGLEERLIQDVRTVSAVEGTKLTILCKLNKPVASAELVNSRDGEKGDAIALTATSAEPLVYSATIEMTQSRRLKLMLVDSDGRKNQKPEQFTINVLPNLPPTLKPVFPAKDLEVSALEELDLRASVSDDYGVKRIGLTYSMTGQLPVDVVLSENAAAKSKHEIAHQIRLEDLKAEPDQLLSYHWWAEDVDPAGKIRRMQSDMYFAEVRPFEEIFRQGEQPPGGEQQQRQRQQQQQQQGEGQNAQDAQQLAKLQKDIMNATWKLIRREIAPELSPAFKDDVEQVRLSQAAAQEQASSLADRIQDEKSLVHVEEVLKQMGAAVEQLTAAAEGPAREPLPVALAAEQAAYQSLLRLRAREHEVVRQQQQQQQQSQQRQQQNQSRSQQQREQLQQLDLKEEQNRYETERTAQEQQQESAEERENRQVLNRLRELAQRQHDLNDRLKELQSALEEAQTPQEKEEIRRQLKRLQDEERQILQDTDELQSRLDQPQNQERNAEQQRQLDETRDQVRKASEALEENKVSQAAAAGTRAEQQFDELREEFRRRAANRFSEEVQELRQTAREIEQKEAEIKEEIKELTEPKPQKPMLREEETNREPLAQDLNKQRERLGQLQERMRDTIERAEATEPILSERLYETARNLRDQKIDRALQSAERSVRQGLNQDAQQQETAAGEGIRQLREGIERAAEGVLGDETEALRRARAELQELSRELNRELQNNRPQEGQQPGDRQPGEQQPGQQPGNQQGQNQQPGQRQPGEQPGQQPGQSQPGQQPGQQPGPGQGRQPGEQQPMNPPQGQQPGNQAGQGNQQGNQPGQGRQPVGPEVQPTNPQNQPGQNQPGQPNQGNQRGGNRNQNQNQFGGTGPFEGDEQEGPLTGERFREWSDRLRDVEEMVSDPELRAEAARIRERARSVRAETKRHSKEPNWDLVKSQLIGPLNELEQRVSEEVLKRTSKKALVPLDRDPVPPQYSEKTRKYYERLGIGSTGSGK